MSFTIGCTACGARFALPDDLYQRKIKGRTVTIRCKRCSADITVSDAQLTTRGSGSEPPPKRGRMPSAPAIMPPHDETPTVPLTFGAPGHGDELAVEELWVVSFSDDDDRELTADQIGEALRDGEIDKETIVWHEGMPDWLPIESVPELAGALRAAATPTEEEAPISLEPESLDSDAYAAIEPGPSSEDAGGPRALSAGTLFVGAGAPQPPRVPGAKPPVPRMKPPVPATPKPPVVAPAPAVAKRALPTAPPAVKRSMPTPPVDDEAPTSSGTPALTSLAAPRAATQRSQARAADDILGLGTGTIGGEVAPAAFNLQPPTISVEPEAPVEVEPEPASIDFEPPAVDLAPPAQEARKRERAPARATSTEPEQGGKSRAPILVGLGLAAAAFAGWWFFLRAPAPTTVASNDSTPTATAATTDETAQAPAAVAEPTTTASDEAPGMDTANTATPEHAATHATTPAGVHAGAKPEAAPGVPETPPATKEAEPEPPASAAAPAASAPEPPAPEKEVPVAGPFDKSAAAAALSSAAGAASSCRQEGDPSGMASVTVTFAPSGRVTTATVSGPPFAGTKTGGCIAATLRRASVPPFSGPMVTVSKTVVIH